MESQLRCYSNVADIFQVLIRITKFILIFAGLMYSQMSFSNSGAAKGPKFSQAQLTISGKTIQVELAETPEQLGYGLMNRMNLPEDSGMLFIFPYEATRSFWMKNTFVNLSIGFFNGSNKLIDIQDMEAVKSVMEEPKTYTSKLPAKYALEVPKGWFARNKIKLGDTFQLIQEKRKSQQPATRVKR